MTISNISIQIKAGDVVGHKVATTLIYFGPKLKRFWDDIFQAIKVFQLYRRSQDDNARTDTKPHNWRMEKKLLQILLIAALKCITVKWLKPNSPT